MKYNWFSLATGHWVHVLKPFTVTINQDFRLAKPKDGYLMVKVRVSSLVVDENCEPMFDRAQSAAPNPNIEVRLEPQPDGTTIRHEIFNPAADPRLPEPYYLQHLDLTPPTPPKPLLRKLKFKRR